MGVYSDIPKPTYVWPWAVTLTCSECGQSRAYRIEPQGKIPAPFTYCPMCGKHIAAGLPDPEIDMLEVWSKEIGSRLDPAVDSIPMDLVKVMYDGWDWKVDGVFVDFAVKMIDGEEASA